jgi:hypothetical protein
MAETVNLIWGKREAEYFRCDGWTGFRMRQFFCLSGKSICGSGVKRAEILNARLSSVAHALIHDFPVCRRQLLVLGPLLFLIGD